jgi:hypothetical protein
MVWRRLSRELRKIVTSDDMKKPLLDAGGDPLDSTPEEYAQNIQREEGKWHAKIVQGGGRRRAYRNLVAVFLGECITSETNFTGTDGLDMMTIGTEAISPIGAKSLPMS